MMDYHYTINENGTNVIFPIRPGDTVYTIRNKPCHMEVTYPDEYSCAGCKDICDLRKVVQSFVVPDVEWILINYQKFNRNKWFTSKLEAETELSKYN